MEGNSMTPDIHITLLVNHIRTLRHKGYMGEEFVPVSCDVGVNEVLVTGTCPKYNDEEDDIYVEWNNGCYYWADFDRYTPLGNTVVEAYDTLVNYIGRIAMATSEVPLGGQPRA